MVTVGIDGGLTGAIAFIFDDRPAIVDDLPTVTDEDGKRLHGPSLSKLLTLHLAGAGGVRGAYLEQLATGGFTRKSNASSIQSQSITHGTIRCCLEMRGLKVELVHPTRWKKFYGIKNVDGVKNTTASLAIARDLYPDLAQASLTRAGDHNRAEAVLIAHFAHKALA
jgi:hypothetical protein